MRSLANILLLAFLSIFLLSSCQDDITQAINKKNVSVSNPPTNHFIHGFTGLMNGIHSSCIVQPPSREYLHESTAIGEQLPAPAKSYKRYISKTYDTRSEESIKLSIGNLEYIGESVIDQVFFDYFNEGVLPFSDDASKGLKIEYTDPEGTFFTTSNGNQSGSKFEIVSIEKKIVQGLALINFSAEFNCTLYNHESSETIEVTNARFWAGFENR